MASVILWRVRVDRLRQSRVDPGGRARVVVDKVYALAGRHAHFPAGGQWAQCSVVG